jgi:transcription elongation factor/antiterminator RfaH
MTSDLISTQQAADRLGLTTSALHELRCRDDGLSIVQIGFSVGYQLEDIQALEHREVLAAKRPLPLIRAITKAVMSQPVSDKTFIPAIALLPPPAPTASTMTWHLIYTKPRQEAVALTNLSRQGFECYLPILNVEKIRQRKPALGAEVMFPSYLFIRLDTSGSGQSWSPIRSTLGVNQIVKFGGQPAKIDAQLIDLIRYRETGHAVQPMFAPGDHVVVANGPFAGLEAVYRTTDAERRSMSLLEMLSKPMHMHIDIANLRKVG